MASASESVTMNMAITLGLYGVAGKRLMPFRSVAQAYEAASFTTTPVFTTGGGDV